MTTRATQNWKCGHTADVLGILLRHLENLAAPSGRRRRFFFHGGHSLRFHRSFRTEESGFGYEKAKENDRTGDKTRNSDVEREEIYIRGDYPTKPNKPASESQSETKAKENNFPLDTAVDSNGSTTPSRLDDEFNNIPANDETENLPRLQVNSEENKNDQRYPNYKRGDDPAGLFDEEITEMQKSEDEVQRALVKMEADRLLPYLPTSPKFDDSDREQEHVKAKETSGRTIRQGKSRNEQCYTFCPCKSFFIEEQQDQVGSTPSGPSRSRTSMMNTDQVQSMVAAAADDTTEEVRFKVFTEGPGGKADMAELMTRLVLILNGHSLRSSPTVSKKTIRLLRITSNFKRATLWVKGVNISILERI
ncbi:hypothetical protein K435DRAFT_807510 [Dendrothele bispora CBS 962.96]|uniref:Uncharacterized protein n=1 Tax=Dendrothele bispora (strain CBS 962.96) TaxID=1314807 RepID=A0A4V4HCH9_DENBC|nr:hypothetical protein K435DRAFT_807510 [Dendrothele bispora CBS 962.96]